MRIFEGLEGSFDIPAPVITTGTFDGVHVGHRKIIQRINQLASDTGGESVLITFEPHPRLVLFPDDNQLRLLSSKKEKIRLLEAAGVQNLVIIPFTKAFSRLTSFEYVHDLLLGKLKMHQLVIGYDHHFGRNREGSIEQLQTYSQEMGFALEEIPAQDVDDIKVSSTKIRNALVAGDIRLANTFLTYRYGLSGTVVHGDKKGRTIGYPTANIRLDDPLKLVPGEGVYAVTVEVEGKKAGGMLNIGTRPTVDGREIRIEVHIFEWENEIYDASIRLELLERIRDEKKFPGLAALQQQLNQDKEHALIILAAHETNNTHIVS